MQNFVEAIDGEHVWRRLPAATKQQLRDNVFTFLGQVHEARKPYGKADMPLIKTPTLLIGGADTTGALSTNWRVMAEHIAGAQTAVIRGVKKLTGANPIDVLIEFPSGASLYAPQTLSTIADVHAAVEKQAGVGNVWSLDTLRRWLAEKAGQSDVGTLKEYVDLLPEHLTRRFISAGQDAVVVSGRIPDVDASKLLPVVEDLDKKLDAVRAKHPGYRISVTGLPAIAARNSANCGDWSPVHTSTRSPVTMAVALPGSMRAWAR